MKPMTAVPRGETFGDRCDPAADVGEIRVSRDGDSLIVELSLTGDPVFSADVEWTVQFNARSTSGKICGLSNVIEEGQPAATATAYGFDPAFGLAPSIRKALPDGVCDAVLDGSTVRFTVDMSDQDPNEEFLVIGSSRLVFPDDEDQLGSEDDFGFDVILADL